MAVHSGAPSPTVNDDWGRRKWTAADVLLELSGLIDLSGSASAAELDDVAAVALGWSAGG